MFVDLLPETEFVVVDLDSGTVLGTNVRLVRYKRGEKTLLDLDDTSAEEIISYATEKGILLSTAPTRTPNGGK